jgi:hypothetical protein
MTPRWPQTIGADVAGDQSVARPGLAGIAESRPVTIAGCHSLRTCHSSGSCLSKRFMMACVYSDPMEDTAEELTDSLFWRRARPECHCFRKIAQVRGYVSLCQRREIALGSPALQLV